MFVPALICAYVNPSLSHVRGMFFGSGGWGGLCEIV